VLEQVRLTEMRIGVQLASALMYAVIALTVLCWRCGWLRLG
jgi:hypothetical protein